MPNVGFATMQVIPSLKGLDRSLGGELNGPLSKAGSDAGNSASKSFRSKFSGGLKVVGLAAGGALVGGLGAAFAVLKTGADEAKDASAGVAQLNAGIKSTGNVAHVTTPGLEKLASSIQDYSGQTDDSIVKSEQLLLTFTGIRNGVGKNNDIFDQATKATADLAAKMGGDASDSAIQLGKALNDPVKGITKLQRIGVTFTDDQKKQVEALVKTGDVMGAQKIILKELSTEFGGAAKAAGESVPGQLARAKRAFEDLSQGVVETLLPVVMPAITTLTKGLKVLAPIAQKAVQSVTAGIGGLAQKVGTGFHGLLAAFSGEGITSTGFQGVMEHIGEAARNVLPQIKAGISQIIPTLQTFVASAIDLIGNHLIPLFLNFGKAVLPTLISAGQSIAKIFTGSVVPAFKDLVDFASTKVVPVIGLVADKLSGFLSFLSEHQSAVKTFAKVALGLLVVRFAALKINQAITGIKAFVTEIRSNVRSVIAFGKSLGSAVSTMADFAKSAALGAANVIRQTAAFVAQKVAAVASAVATKALAAGQWLLNAAMTANPIGLIVVGIAALVAGFILAYKKIGPFRDAVNALGRAFLVAFNFVKNNWPKILVILTGPFGIAVLLIKAHWDKITGFARAAFDWVKSHWPLLLAILAGPIGLAVLAISKHWDTIKRGVAGVFNAVKGAFDRVVGFLTGVPGRILGALGDLTHLLFDIGGKIIGGLIDGIKNKLGDLKDTLTSIPGKIISWKGPPAKDAKLLTPVGGLIMDGLVTGIRGRMPQLQKQLNEVSKSVKATPMAFGTPKMPKMRLPTHADLTGDLANENTADLAHRIAGAIFAAAFNAGKIPFADLLNAGAERRANRGPKKLTGDLAHERWQDPTAAQKDAKVKKHFKDLAAGMAFGKAVTSGKATFADLFNKGASKAVLAAVLKAHPPVVAAPSPRGLGGGVAGRQIIVEVHGATTNREIRQLAYEGADRALKANHVPRVRGAPRGG